MKIVHDGDTVIFKGDSGNFRISREDEPAWKLAMLIEAKCSRKPVKEVAGHYGFSHQRYYQLLAGYEKNGSPALRSDKRGPQKAHKRTEEVIKQVIRYRYLDKDSRPEVISQKLKQNGFDVSARSVFRIFEDYGLQKRGSINAILRRGKRKKSL